MKIQKLLLVPLIVGLGFELVLTNLKAGGGVEMGEIEAQIIEIKRQNLILKEQIDKSSSLTQIATRVEELGLIKPELVLYIDVPAAVDVAAVISQ